MFKCSKCGYLKSTPNSKCFCNKGKYEGPKLGKKAPTPIPVISEKKKERLQDDGTEVDLFKKRFTQLKKQNKNFCMVTGKVLNMDYDSHEETLTVASFPHILAKGLYPEFRYFTNNIGLVKGITEHKIFDEWISNYKKSYGLDNLINDIKNGKEVYEDILIFNKNNND